MSRTADNKILVIKVCGNEWQSANRDKRELGICRDLGMNTLVLAKGKQNDKLHVDEVSGFPVRRMSTRPLGIKIPESLNRVVSLFIWAKALKSLHGDIISGHDLIGLTISWMSTWLIQKSRKPLLVYDSHEFEIERSGNRGKAAKWFVKVMEGFLMRRCALSIMVNDSIADEVQKIHKLKERPLVVRNIPPRWNIDEAECKKVKAKICAELHVPEDTFMIMYHGGILKNRGVEAVIEQVKRNRNITGFILGNGDEKYIQSLKALTIEKGVEDRVLFHPAVTVEELWKYVGAADVGMVTVRNSSVSYYYMLPNKFFENIQSMTPVIGSDFPEIRRIVKKYNIGLLCDPDDMDTMAECVERMRTDKQLYASMKYNLIQVKEELCWENEKEILRQAYQKLADE